MTHLFLLETIDHFVAAPIERVAAPKWPVEGPRTKLGDDHGIEQKDGPTNRDADRKLC